MSSKEIIRCPGKLNCLLLVCLAKISQLFFQKDLYIHILKMNQNMYLAFALQRKKYIVAGKYFRFTKLEEDFLKFKFVIFKAFGMEYSNQIMLCFMLLQRHFCY